MDMGNRSFAGVAQLVELQPSKLDVAGSRPVSRSVAKTAHVAQLAEHVLGKDEVTSSILVVGSSNFFCLAGVTQWLESRPSKPLVAGSNPVSRSLCCR